MYTFEEGHGILAMASQFTWQIPKKEIHNVIVIIIRRVVNLYLVCEYADCRLPCSEIYILSRGQW